MHSEAWRFGPGTTAGDREVSRQERDEPRLKTLTEQVDELACTLESAEVEMRSEAAQDAVRRAYALLVSASDALAGKVSA